MPELSYILVPIIIILVWVVVVTFLIRALRIVGYFD